MNDTKWREVWAILADLQARFYFAYANDHTGEWNRGNATTLFGPFSPDDIDEGGVKDPGIGGPFRFKDILAIKVPRRHVPSDVRWPVVENDVDALESRLKTLGQLPMHITSDMLEIRGYEH